MSLADWQRRYDEAVAAKRHHKASTIVGLLMVVVGSAAYVSGHKAHAAAAEPCVWRDGGFLGWGYTWCPENREGMTGMQFGAIATVIGGLTAIVSEPRWDAASQEIKELKALRSTVVELPVTLGNRQGLAIVTGRATGLRYRLTW